MEISLIFKHLLMARRNYNKDDYTSNSFQYHWAMYQDSFTEYLLISSINNETYHNPTPSTAMLGIITVQIQLQQSTD